jgi:phosphoserine phosphatase
VPALPLSIILWPILHPLLNRSGVMNLAIFDLDNTLLDGDSDYLWGQFLVERGLVDGPDYAHENQRYYAAYKAGTLDIREFLRFSLRPFRLYEERLVVILCSVLF